MLLGITVFVVVAFLSGGGGCCFFWGEQVFVCGFAVAGLLLICFEGGSSLRNHSLHHTVDTGVYYFVDFDALSLSLSLSHIFSFFSHVHIHDAGTCIHIQKTKQNKKITNHSVLVTILFISQVV